MKFIPEEVEAAHRLFEGHADLPRYQLLGVGQDHRVANLFALAIALHLSIESGTLARFRVGVIWTDLDEF